MSSEPEYMWRSLNYKLLVQILEEDEPVRSLIQELFRNQLPEQPPQTGREDSLPLPQVQAPDNGPNFGDASVRDNWQCLYAVLTMLQADDELSRLLLGDAAVEGAPLLLRLVARGSQWECLLNLWDLLCTRCKTGARVVTAAERQALGACLSLHNLIWDQHEASLLEPERGARYDYQRHQLTENSASNGESVICCLLPGLSNAAGKLTRKALVAT